VPPSYDPPITLTQHGGRLRLRLGNVCHGHGDTLPEAADDLIRRLLGYVVAIRAGGVGGHTIADLPMLNFLHELGDIAAAGGDIRRRVFAGPTLETNI
jgi:hypothetical protein